MAIVSTTMCYPSAAASTQGVFIKQRLRAIGRRMPVRVVAPVPWFPLLRPRRLAEVDTAPAGATADVSAGEPAVVRPRMFYVPGLMKRCDAAFYAAAFGTALRALRREGRVDLIDAHFVWPDGVGAWRVARRARLPFVCTIRGKLVSQIAHRSRRRQIGEMLRDADALIAVSRSLAALANDVAGRELDARVIPNGVDRTVFHRRCAKTAYDSALAKTQSAEALDRPADARLVVSVGHLQALKGFDRLVEIWPEVRRRAGDVRLVLVGGPAGEPDYARRLRASVDAVNASENCVADAPAVTCLGRQTPQTVARLLNAADLFALVSRSEGWCNAIVEALACGCPVVATDVGGNREIVEDSSLGWLVPFGDRQALVEAICRGLSTDWDREHIARMGGRRDWQQVARQCVDVFESVLR